MTEAVLRGVRDIEIRQAGEPEAGTGEVRLRPQWVGICGSDLHAWKGEHPFITPPVVPGHEFSAISERDGARVTVEPNLVCGECRNCREGRYNICDSLKVIGCQSPGAMADALTVPDSKLVPLPDAMSFEDACLVEPLAVGVHAVRRAGLQTGESVLILGAGTIGLMCLQAARAAGAGRIAVSDMQNWRLALAESLGADSVLRADDADLRASVRAALGPDGPDVILECVGHPAAVRSAIAVSRKGGRIVVVGVHGEPASLNVGLVQDWELEIRGTLMYTRPDFEAAVSAIAAGQARTAPFITHRFPLEDAPEAFRTLEDPDSRALKVLVQVAGR